jgi:hypothetical protein
LHMLQDRYSPYKKSTRFFQSLSITKAHFAEQRVVL